MKLVMRKKNVILKKNEILDKIEQEECLQLFNFANTSSWVFIKDYLYWVLVCREYSQRRYSFRTHLNYRGIYLFILSFINFVCSFLRFKDSLLYIGAGSRILKTCDNEFHDIYLPKAEKDRIIYFISGDSSVNKLYERRKYIRKNRIVITSLLLTPLRNIIKCLLVPFYYGKRKDFWKFCIALNKYDLQIDYVSLMYYHLKFVAGYYLYKGILNIFKFKKAYVVCAYEKADLVAACIAKNIIVTEIQHGIIGKLHRGYNYKCPSEIKLPTPDYVVVSNLFWKNELIDAGYYKNEQVLLDEASDENCIRSIDELRSERYVVFTSQNIINNQIVDFLKEANDFLSKRRILLYYLPHPTELEVDLDRLQSFLKHCTNIKVVLNKQFTTNEYIYHSLAHISLFSTCHFDSFFLKGKTFILNILSENVYEYYVEKYPDNFLLIKRIEDILLYTDLI